MTDLFQGSDDATPLDPVQREGLLQTWITNRNDLNEAEEENIVKGAAWARRRRGRKPVDMLNDEYVETLHKRMFGDVWRWAGTYRQSELNIGIAANRIPMEMPAMLDDVRYWVDHNTYPSDEIAVRLHHRLTQIHAFPNGNGRHARMMADLLIERLGGKPFSWGGDSLADVGTLRAQYVAALQAADGHNMEPLMAFVLY
jgi:Fic-DOC domain mobile mystery protein B